MLFSILIPAYKEHYLKECLQSLSKQSFTDFEIIIVNDHSPENLEDIVISANDNRIHYYCNDRNYGAIDVVDNWNKCLSYAKGEYVICMGDDDCLTPECLSEYSRLIKKYPGIGALHAWTEIIDDNSQFQNITAPRPEWESVYSLCWNRFENRHKQFIGDWCFETEWLRSQGGFYKLPLAWASDDITALLCAKKNGVANTQRICFQYRQSRYTITNTGNITFKMEAVKKEKDWYENFLLVKPQNDIDLKYWECIIKLLPKHIERKYAALIAEDLKKHPLHFVKWYFSRKIFGYNLQTLIMSIILSRK